MLRESPDDIGLETALDLHRKGLRLIPLAGKRALIKDWPDLRLAESEVRDWSARGVNWGVITGEPLVVLDTDSDKAEAWVRANGIDSPVVVRTGGGGLHRYFRASAGVEVHSRSAVRGVGGLDVKGWRSYVVAPGSVHPTTLRRYQFLPDRSFTDLSALPEFDPTWVLEMRAEPLSEGKTGRGGAGVRGPIRDVRAYIRAIKSVEGSGGDRACFRVACLLVEAGLGFADALAEMEAWNKVCGLPPWSRKELIHKVRCAFKRVLGMEVGRVG